MGMVVPAFQAEAGGALWVRIHSTLWGRFQALSLKTEKVTFEYLRYPSSCHFVFLYESDIGIPRASCAHPGWGCDVEQNMFIVLQKIWGVHHNLDIGAFLLNTVFCFLNAFLNTQFFVYCCHILRRHYFFFLVSLNKSFSSILPHLFSLENAVVLSFGFTLVLSAWRFKLGQIFLGRPGVKEAWWIPQSFFTI